MNSSLDSRSLGIFRIGLGFVVLADLLDRGRYLELYANETMVESFGVTNPVVLWSFHALNGSLHGQLFWFIVAAIAATFLTVGYKSRPATIVTALMTISLQHRNPYILYGADDLLRLLLIWGSFLPLGRSFSIDAHRAKISAADVSTPATQAFIFQVAMIFILAGCHKISDPVWRHGSALIQGVATHPGPFADLVLQHKTVFTLMNWVVMAIQFLGGLSALFRRTRGWAALVFIPLQVGMGMTMDINMFPFTVTLAWIALIPSEFWPESVGAPVRYGHRWAIAALSGVLIPLACEAAETLSPEGPAMGLAISTGFRQHWRMFTPAPTERTWTAAMVTDTEHRQYDIAGRNFSFEPPQKVNGWMGSRFGALAYSLGKDPAIAHRLFQSYCDEPRGRLPASIQTIRLYKLTQNIVDSTKGVTHNPVVEHRCAD